MNIFMLKSMLLGYKLSGVNANGISKYPALYPPGLVVWTICSTIENAFENHKGTLLQTSLAMRFTQSTVTNRNDAEKEFLKLLAY